LSHVNRQYIKMRRRRKWWSKMGGYPKVAVAYGTVLAHVKCLVGANFIACLCSAAPDPLAASMCTAQHRHHLWLFVCR
jgi:hypothetical protein